MTKPLQKQIDPAAQGRVLVVDDHARARESIADILRQQGHHADCCSSAVEAIKLLEGDSYDLVLTDLQMPGMSGLDFIKHVQRCKLRLEIVMITAHASVSTAVEAMRLGAFDYIEKPLDVDRLEEVTARALQHHQLLYDQQMPECSPGEVCHAMVGSSDAMQELRQRIAQIAATSETVLITGESGTGKEMVARSLHAASSRKDRPLVSLNCPVLSEHLMESELFGHERGAFTGAESQRRGRFELAHGSTILLDEITEIALPLQAKLLRVLQEQSFERVGSSESLQVDVRVISTTNRNLIEEITAGNFRQDLYYRLAVVPLHVPALRERREDVPELVAHFLERAASRLQREPCQMDAGAEQLLSEYRWPGNVRELENIVTRASVLNTGKAIMAEDLQPWLMQADEAAAAVHENAQAAFPAGMSLEEMERKLIETTLEQFNGHRANTAEALGIGVRTLSGKLKSYGYAPRTKSFARAS